LESWLFADDSVAEQLRANLGNLTLEDLRHVYATIFLAHVGLTYPSSDRTPMIRLPEVIYHQPKSYIDRWVQFLEENFNDERFGMRVIYRINDEINPILGVDNNNVVTAIAWTSIMKTIGTTTAEMNNERFAAAARTDVENAVRAEKSSSASKGCAVILLALIGAASCFAGLSFAF
jgi:hypothetical protein